MIFKVTLFSTYLKIILKIELDKILVLTMWNYEFIFENFLE